MLFGGGALTSLLLGWTGSGTLQAQTGNASPSAYTQSAPQVPRNYLNKNVIQLPIQIDAASRAKIREIHLYIKDHASAAWSLREKVGPAQTAFTIQLPRDGEYWFTMVTVDTQGRSFPSDLTKEPAGLNVVIDTQGPQIDLANLGVSAEGQLIQCDVSDPNLDAAQTRFFFQGGDGNFRPADPLPGRANVFCIPAQAVFSGVIRVMAQDFAKNESQREMHVNKMTARNAVTVNVAQQEVITPRPMPVGPPETKPSPTKLAVNVINTTPEMGQGDPVMAQKSPYNTARPDGSDGPRLPDHTSGSSPIVTPPAVTPPSTNNVQTVALKRQIVNSTRVFLDYQIENAGESGIGKVEVWITRDQSKSWQRLSEDKQRKSPVEVQFPGDGLYGVTLVVSNGRGTGGAPPAAGDTPDWWIEVDTTRPTAQFTKVHSVTEEGKAVVHIYWAASDKNLGDTPVDLFYSKSPQGPWLSIAKGLKGEGQHSWAPPRDIGSQAHVQLSVRDLAGNTSVVHTLVPVLFDDPARPRALIRGVTTGTPPPLQIVQPNPGP
jgi:hypothetical protein